MQRYVIEDSRHILPFNTPASELNVGVLPLKIHHENLFTETFKHCDLGGAVRDDLGSRYQSPQDIPGIGAGETIVYRNNLWFDREFLEYFLAQARRSKKRVCRAAFAADDLAFRTYTLPLAKGFKRQIDPRTGKAICLADLWYLPQGHSDEPETPIVVPSEANEKDAEKGFYNVPDFMAQDRTDLTHYLPARAVLSIESWVHIFYGSVVFGVFSRGSRFEKHVNSHVFPQIRLIWRGILEQKQVLTTSEVVKVGKGTIIDPSAIISGPTTIGQNCYIGPGVVIDNCAIGDNVNISQGCQLMLSTVGDSSFLPFRASLFMTALMDHTIIAQNTCLQMCVIGRYSFVGAGNTFTDFNLIQQKPIRTTNIDGELEEVGQVVLGGAVGHNCRIGSGMLIFPGRTIESDTVLVASPSRRIVNRNVTYEESDHHPFEVSGAAHHPRKYPHRDQAEADEETWDRW